MGGVGYGYSLSSFRTKLAVARVRVILVGVRRIIFAF